MTVDVALTLEELRGIPLAGLTVVVVDVVRASTTIVTALAHGARAVVPAASPEEAATRARRWPGGALLGGERGGAPPPGFDCGNSPAEYTAERVAGRVVVLTTTNGTRALLAARGAAALAVGAFVNAAAVVRWVARRRGDVLLVCAGESGRFCLEDATCAGLLVRRLEAHTPGVTLTDAARAAAVLADRYGPDLADMLGQATWARLLVARGHGADLRRCAALDLHAVVPVAEGEAFVAAPGG